MEKKYWNSFYEKNKAMNEPTLFAEWVLTQINEAGSILDIGCGNGRDSIYFMKNGLEVYAVDSSDIATQYLLDVFGERMHVLNEDFVAYLGEVSEFNYLYSRFTIHAINEEEQNKLLRNAYEALKDDGQIFIEVRCTEDELFGKGDLIDKNTYFYDGHNRRFIEKEELEQNLLEIGFKILYSEQKSGFAPFGDVDPVVLRVVAQK